MDDDLKAVVSDGVKAAARQVKDAPGRAEPRSKALDMMADITRKAPLPALLIAFLIGAAVARRS